MEDCLHTNYEEAPDDGSAWLGGNCHYRVLRGGSWQTRRYLRSAHRNLYHTKEDRERYAGFRVARSLVRTWAEVKAERRQQKERQKEREEREWQEFNRRMVARSTKLKRIKDCEPHCCIRFGDQRV